MSHFSCVRTKMSDVNRLKGVLRSIGVKHESDRILVSHCGATTANNVAVACWVPVKNEMPLEANCGFHLDGDALYFASYAGDGTQSMADMFQQVLSRYAVDEALASSTSMRDKGAHVNVRVSA